MRKKIRIVSFMLVGLAILFSVWTFISVKPDFIEAKVPGESTINVSKGMYTVYLMNSSTDDIGSKKYFFELKDQKNNVLQKFPDPANTDAVSSIKKIRQDGKTYIAYADFTIDVEGDYLLQSYSKDAGVREIAIKKEGYSDTQNVNLYLISLILLGISIVTFIISFFIKK